jgi:HAD superfamily hydrolase (TIGR01509 family)
MTIQGSIFDFGQVLTAPADMTSVTKHRAKLAAQLGLETAELWPYLFEGKTASKLMTDQIDWETFWAEILGPKGITDADEIKAFSESVFKGSDVVHPDINKLIQELHGRYKLAILSNANWSETQLTREIAERGGQPELFDAIISSASVGFAKPHPAIYQVALDRLQLTAEECVFTDDLEEFALAAGELGFHAFTFTTPAEFRQYLKEEGVAAIVD